MKIGDAVHSKLANGLDYGEIISFSPCGKYAHILWETNEGRKYHRVARVDSLRLVHDFTKKEVEV